MLSFLGCCIGRQKTEYNNLIDGEEEKSKDKRDNAVYTSLYNNLVSC